MVNALVRIPIEALVAAALLIVLPARPRRIVAGVLGFVLGLLTVIKIVDLGFYAVLAREFDPVLDWVLFADGYHFLQDSLGKTGALLVAVGVVVLSAAILTFMTLAMIRLSRVLAAHKRVAGHTVFAFASAWLVCLVFGIEIVGGVPVAAQSAADLARDTALKVPQDIADQKAFEREVQVDAFKDTPGNELLTGLRGKDVIIGFVESYGRDAVQNPDFDTQVLAQLTADDGKLAAEGFRGQDRLPHLVDRGRRQLAGPLHLAVRTVDRQPAALPEPGVVATGSPSPGRSNGPATARSGSSRASRTRGRKAVSTATTRSTTRTRWATTARR